MQAKRVVTLLIAAALILGAFAFRAFNGGDEAKSPTRTEPRRATPAQPTPPSGDTVEVAFFYSPEKKPLVEPLLAEFNDSRQEVDGRVVHVTGTVMSSGEAARKMGSADVQPDLWSPASSLWGQVANASRSTQIAPPQSPSLVRSPLVIAMWEPMARALGWPKKPLGWSDVLREARSAQGWAAHGHPEWGAFKLGHTNPDYSTSGLEAVAAEYMFATGKLEGITLQDVNSDKVRAQVKAIERSIVHYGDTTLFFADQLAQNGPGYASAVAMEEVTLLDFNLNRSNGGQRLVAIYPKEGSFVSDNPLFVMDAPWSSDDTKAGATKVSEFLRQRVTAEKAGELFFRPGDETAAPTAPITAENLVDPRQPTRVLGVPQPEVLKAISAAWRVDRKPAHVQVVLDVSGSMNDAGKLQGALKGLSRFIMLMQPQDEVGLTVFNGVVTTVVPPVRVSQGRMRLLEAVKSQIADGDTALLDATTQAVEQTGRAARPDRISAVVVLSDGRDTASEMRPATAIAQLTRQTSSEGAAVRVFTIAYGDDADRALLERIAEAGRGKAYVGDPTTIEAVYTQIASFF